MKPLTPASPHAIIMVGIPGSGKSTFAEHFAETFQAPIINESRLAFEADLNAAQTVAVSRSLLKEVLKAKRTFLFEAANSTRKTRSLFINQITKAGYKPLIVWVQTESLESKRRALKKLPNGSGLLGDEFDEIVRKFEAPLPKDSPIVISGKHTYATQLKVVLKHLAGSRPAEPITPPSPRRHGNITVR